MLLERVNFALFYFFLPNENETEVIKTEFMWMNINSTLQCLQLDHGDNHCSLLKWKSSCHYLILVSKCCLGVGSKEQMWVAFPAHFTGTVTLPCFPSHWIYTERIHLASLGWGNSVFHNAPMPYPLHVIMYGTIALFTAITIISRNVSWLMSFCFHQLSLDAYEADCHIWVCESWLVSSLASLYMSMNSGKTCLLP